MGFIDIVPFSLTTPRPEPEPRDLEAEAAFLERFEKDWLAEFGEERGPATATPTAAPARSTLTMITLTKPIERKGWRSTSVTRSRKPTPEFSGRADGTEDRGSSKPSAGGDALTLSLETLGHAADPFPHLLVGEALQETPQ